MLFLWGSYGHTDFSISGRAFLYSSGVPPSSLQRRPRGFKLLPSFSASLPWGSPVDETLKLILARNPCQHLKPATHAVKYLLPCHPWGKGVKFFLWEWLDTWSRSPPATLHEKKKKLKTFSTSPAPASRTSLPSPSSLAGGRPGDRGRLSLSPRVSLCSPETGSTKPTGAPASLLLLLEAERSVLSQAAAAALNWNSVPKRGPEKEERKEGWKQAARSRDQGPRHPQEEAKRPLLGSCTAAPHRTALAWLC